MTSEETSVHTRFQFNMGANQEEFYTNMHILWGERKRLHKKFMCFCQVLEVNFIWTTKKKYCHIPLIGELFHFQCSSSLQFLFSITTNSIGQVHSIVPSKTINVWCLLQIQNKRDILPYTLFLNVLHFPFEFSHGECKGCQALPFADSVYIQLESFIQEKTWLSVWFREQAALSSWCMATLENYLNYCKLCKLATDRPTALM